MLALPAIMRDVGSSITGWAEGDHDARSAWAGQGSYLIRHVLHHPQPVTGHVGQRVHQHPAGSAPGPGAIRSRLSGSGPVAAVNLTLQRPGQVPYPQPPRPGAIADDIRRHFMYG